MEIGDAAKRSRKSRDTGAGKEGDGGKSTSEALTVMHNGIRLMNRGEYANAILSQALQPIARDRSKKGLEQFGEGWKELALALSLDGLPMTCVQYYALGGMTNDQFDYLAEHNEEFGELVQLWKMASQCYMEAMGSQYLLDKTFNNGLYLFMMKSRYRDTYGDNMEGAVQKALEKLGVNQGNGVMTQEQMVKIAAAIRNSANIVAADRATIN